LKAPKQADAASGCGADFPAAAGCGDRRQSSPSGGRPTN
jgi:hypothetical protein